eukprot:gene22831-22829_t
MIVYLAGLQGIPDELYDAARIDGANAFQRFWHVTMPGLRPTHVFVLVITTIQAFKLYTQVAILTQGGPKSSTETVVHYMVRAGFEEQKLGYASAVSSAAKPIRSGARTLRVIQTVSIFIIALVVLVTYFVVFVERGQRKILVNYARRQVGNKVYGGQSSHLPLKLNMAGVIPPIFASSII